MSGEMERDTQNESWERKEREKGDKEVKGVQWNRTVAVKGEDIKNGQRGIKTHHKS